MNAAWWALFQTFGRQCRVVTELHFQYSNYRICKIYPHLISSNRMSTRPTCAAWYIGVLRWWMLPFGSAPAFRRIFTQSRCPLTTAMYRAVWPFTSTRSTAAPWEIRYSTHSLWPIMAAIRSGVQGSQPQDQINFSLICLKIIQCYTLKKQSYILC